MIFLLKTLVVILFVILLFGFCCTWVVEHSYNQKQFLAGTAPNPTPDGLYSGTVPGHTVSWLGKKFNAASSTGINVFDDGKDTNGNIIQGERYPFKTSYVKGSRDKNLDVLAIDYNIATNPFWLRLILDEIVQVAPGQYLGKLEVRIIPRFPFTLAFFELKKSSTTF